MASASQHAPAQAEPPASSPFSDQHVGIDQLIKEIFQWPIPELSLQAPTDTASMVTAPPLTDAPRTKRKSHPAPTLTNDTHWPPVSLPSDFELHMAHDLLLKRVVRCPGLGQALADISAERADALSEYVAALPHDVFAGHDPAAYEEAVKIETSVDTISDIHHAYEKFESLVVRIVGALYHPMVNMPLQSFLVWKSRAMYGLHRSIGDGYAYIHPGLPGIPRGGAQPEAKELNNVTLQNLNPFVVLSVHPVGDPYWATGLSSGQDDLFDAIQTLPDEEMFHWRSCGPRYGCASDLCTHRGVHSVSGRQTGLDSDILEDILARAENAVPVQSMAAEVDPTITRTSHPFRKKAERLVQAVWSKGVASDATFILMSTGNRDLIAMRDRDTQTLYLSQTMTHQSQDLSPYAVHAGAIYSALKDVIARAKKIERRRATESIMPDRFTRTYHIDAMKGPLLPSTDYLEDDDELRQGASVEEMVQYFKDHLAVCWDDGKRGTTQTKFSNIGRFTSPWVVRKMTVSSTTKTPKPQKCLSVVRLEHRVSNDNFLFICHFQQDYVNRAIKGGTVIAKVATVAGRFGLDMLRHEYQIYELLATETIDSIPKVYGFYDSTIGVKGGILFMERFGKPLKLFESSDIPKTLQPALEEWTRALHAAGFTHNNLTDEHILIDDSQRDKWRFRVVSWKHADYFASDIDRNSDHAEAKRKDEMAMLRICFPSGAKKRKATKK